MNPNFKPIPGIFEERYESFMAIPIVQGLSRVGVLTLQREERNHFKENDVIAMRAIASQLANILENAKLLMTLGKGSGAKPVEETLGELKFIKGRKASEGYAYSPATIF